jgi:hypothetical protein
VFVFLLTCRRKTAYFFVKPTTNPMKAIINSALSRLKEKSTWAGLASLVALAGLKVDPDLFGQISTAAIALIGLYEIARKESK